VKVLIVDDQEVNRKLPAAILTKFGIEVLNACDGQSALDVVGQNADITHILLDVSMPGMSGSEVCRILRQNTEAPPLRIVAYTAHAFPSEKQEIMAAGFDELLIKPITRAALLESLGIEG
jgi:CheY-like chemotaxis protein